MSAKAKSSLTPEQRKATLRRVLKKIRPYRFFVGCSLIVAAVSVAAQLYIPILCGSAIDLMLGKGRVDFAGVMQIIMQIVAVAILAAFAQWLLSVCNNRITFSVSRDLRSAALRKIQTLPLSYLDSHPSGDIVSRMIADVDTFADGLLMGFTQLFSGLLTIFGTLLFMLWENVPITLVVVCITPLSLVVASFLAKRSYKYFQGQSTVRGEQTALVNEMIEGQKVVQAFGHEAESLAAFDEVNTRLQDVSLKAIFFSSMTNPATRFVNNIVYAGVGLVGAIYAVAGGITIGQLSIFLNYANQYTKPFNEISGVVTELQNALACAARVFELLDADDQVPEAEHARVLQPDGHVELKDVSFRYLPDRPLIEGLNLDVKPGQRIAIVGPTGCGKTTLINLLMRFYDVNSGSITVSGDDSITASGASMKTLGAADAVLRAYPNAAYVMFKQPAVSEGRLLYNFRSVAAQNYTAVDYSKDQFYLSGTSAKNLYLDSVFFLPAADCSTQIRLAFTVYGTSGTQLGSGELTVRVASKTASSVFSDVNARTCSWAANAVDFMNEYGLVKGTGTSTFGWKGSMTRGDFVLILYRNAGSPSVYGVSNPFTDVKSTDYYYEAVLWAYRNNVVNGTSTTTFSPNANVTREQMAAILYRYAQYKKYNTAASSGLNGFTDHASVSGYAAASLEWAVAEKLVNGSAGKLMPTGNATRAEFATIAALFFHAPEVEDDAFTDISDSWARDYINRAAKLGLISGYKDGTFRPQNQITRAEVMEIINNVLFRTPDKDHLLPDMIVWPDNSNKAAWYYAAVQEATNGHEYERVDNTSPETWTELRPPRDWDALEAELSQKYPDR